MKQAFPRINASVCNSLLSAIHDTPGDEVAGFLVEYGDKLKFRRLRNLGGVGEFWVEPLAVERILRDITRTQGSVKGFVHSHSTDCQLSCADQASLGTSPWPWLVIVPQRWGIKGRWFRTEGNRVVSGELVCRCENSCLRRIAVTTESQR